MQTARWAWVPVQIDTTGPKHFGTGCNEECTLALTPVGSAGLEPGREARRWVQRDLHLAGLSACRPTIEPGSISSGGASVSTCS